MSKGLLRHKIRSIISVRKSASRNLWKAVRKRDLNLALQAIEAGANVNSVDFEGRTPLAYGVQENNMKLCKFLVAHGCDIDVQNNHGQTALCWAVAGYNFTFIRFLIESGADVKIKDNHSYTALNFIALFYEKRAGYREKGITKLVNMFLEAGADKEDLGINNWQLLFSAVRYKDGPLVKQLLSFGADVNTQWGDSKMTALMFAVESGDIDIIREIVNAGADLDIKNDDGKTVLDLSLEENHHDIAALIKYHIQKQKERQECTFDLNI